jgi:apolipoprotein N-acyltransferase
LSVAGGFGKEQSKPMTVRLVQPAVSQQMKWDETALTDNLNAYISLSLAASEEPIDFVVWGETAVPFDPNDSKIYRDLIATAAPENGYLVTGVLRRDEETFYNSLYVLDRQGNLIDFYDKSHLVPFGEYIPLRRFLPDRIRPVAGRITDLGVGKAFKPLFIPTYPSVGALICYEIIFPNAVIDRAHKPQWLLLLSNDGWYGKSAGPYQHLVAARMRAVEEGVTVVRSANTGISAVIDPFGRVIDELGLSQSGFLDVKLPSRLALATPYSSGSSVWIVLTALVMYLCLWRKRGKE